MSYPILGVSAHVPRKCMEGYLWFADDVPPATASAIAREVPKPFRFALEWRARSVLRIGTADDAKWWAQKLGSWDVAIDQLLRFLAKADARAPLALYLGGSSLGSRDVPVLVSTVFPWLRAWFDAAPVVQSTEHDMGSFVANVCFAIVDDCTKKGLPVPEAEAWWTLLRSALGRSSRHDLERLLAFGSPPKDWAETQDDPRMVIPVSHHLPSRVSRAGLLLRVVEQRAVNADWFARALERLGSWLLLRSTAKSATARRHRLEVDTVLNAAAHDRVFGSSVKLTQALLKVSRPAGRWDVELATIREALSGASVPSSELVEIVGPTLAEAARRQDTNATEELQHLLAGAQARAEASVAGAARAGRRKRS